VDQVAAHRWVEPFGRERDRRIAEALDRDGISFRLFEGETLLPPGSVRTGQGGMFRVFTPFARACGARLGSDDARLHAPRPLPPIPPDVEVSPLTVPGLAALGLERNTCLLPGGERAAQARLAAFCSDRLDCYGLDRDRMDLAGTSRLSGDLKFGTLSVRQVWRAVSDHGGPGARPFLNELLWREFSHHLLWEWPELLERAFRPAFDGFPWRADERAWEAWCEGRTGYPVVDAAARQLKAEGFVHNRARMVAASFLAKHLMVDWRRGEAHYLRWLADGDWAANNAGWQWSAGCGCDAQPWFRIFNPVSQGVRFDPEGAYVKRWVPELATCATDYIHEPWKAPRTARVRLDYPDPCVDHAFARELFLAETRIHLASSARGGHG
jgi:deoxyribodipyrimidine photo-lyase